MSTYATDTFAGDDSTVEFTLTFSYLSRDHIKVFRVEKADGAETELSVITTGAPTGDEFIWESDNKIKVGTAPTVDQTLKIQRDTPEDQQLVPWSDGSYLISEDLNDSDKQWLYNIQELSDLFSDLDSEAIKYRGTIDLTVDAAPANPNNGDFYINSGSGTVLASWTGLGGDSVTGSEQVIYNSSLGEWELLKTPASQKGVLEVTGTAPIQVDNTDAQRPVVSVNAATTTAAGVINEAASDNVVHGRQNGAWVAVANTAVSANPPANPSNGDGWYDLNTGRLYLWINDGDSSQWAEANPGLAGGGASVEVGETAPTNPSDGDLWWDSSDDSGRLYVYYEDGSTNQWVEASPPAAANPTVKVSDTPPASPEPGDLWWDSSETGGENGGRLYFRYSDADSQQWVQTSNVGGANGQIWGRTGTTISPATAGDDVDLGTGDLSAVGGTFSGDVLVGTDSAVNIPGCKLDTAGVIFSLRSAGSTAPIFQGGVVGAGTNVQLNADGTADFYTPNNSNAVFMRWFSDIGGAKTEKIRFVTNGDAFKPNGGSWGSISDARSKTVVSPYQSSLAEIKQVEPVLYKYHGLDREYVGIVAQQVETVMPELVSVSPGTTYDGTEIEDLRSVDQTPLTFALINAVKEMATRIEALEAEVQSLKGGSN